MYEGEAAKEMIQCLVRAIDHYQNQAHMLYENPPKMEEFDIEFTTGIAEIAEEDLLVLTTAAEGLANAIRDALGTESRHNEIKEIIDNNQELVNSCIDSYIVNLEKMKESITEVFAPAIPKLSKLEHELELAKNMQQVWSKKKTEEDI